MVSLRYARIFCHIFYESLFPDTSRLGQVTEYIECAAMATVYDNPVEQYHTIPVIMVVKLGSRGRPEWVSEKEYCCLKCREVNTLVDNAGSKR